MAVSTVTEATRSTAPALIRPFTDDDYPGVVAVAVAIYPGYNDTVEQWRRHEALRPPDLLHMRWVAERDGRMAGYARLCQFEWMRHPQKFGIDVFVHPEFEGQGIGSALYDMGLARAEALDPVCLLSGTREDRPRGIRFLEDRGFTEVMRDRESWLMLADFDEAAFSGDDNVPAAHGIALKSYDELACDPDRDRKIYDLDTNVTRDMPCPEPFTELGFEHFRDHVLRDPDMIPGMYLVAVHGNEYVGLSVLAGSAGSRLLFNGTTGVRHEWRGKGIATALKVRNARRAKEMGFEKVITWNEVNNRAMLGINERLGFVKQPEWIRYRKTYREEEP